ncbi:MAG: signal peptidase I [Nitrospirae bacterium]|nr:signal peptidase I [Nitrospirota bacterium]MCL5978873.1 signal peptidase I [Nitrospirota bacterium]
MRKQVIKWKQSKLWEYTKAIGIALLLALVIRTYVVQAFKIPSGSMLQTLLVGDHILVNKFIYGTKIPFSDKRILILTKPMSGDIIVFKFPEDPSRDFIKRVIAVEGDMIESRDKKILVNGKSINEPYAQHTDNSTRMGGMEPRDNFGPYLVPKNKVFVMGDNRDQSYDSRYWGYVDMKELRGKAFIIYWSWDGIKKMPRLGRMGKLVR